MINEEAKLDYSSKNELKKLIDITDDPDTISAYLSAKKDNGVNESIDNPDDVEFYTAVVDDGVNMDLTEITPLVISLSNCECKDDITLLTSDFLRKYSHDNIIHDSDDWDYWKDMNNFDDKTISIMDYLQSNRFNMNYSEMMNNLMNNFNLTKEEAISYIDCVDMDGNYFTDPVIANDEVGIYFNDYPNDDTPTECYSCDDIMCYVKDIQRYCDYDSIIDQVCSNFNMTPEEASSWVGKVNYNPDFIDNYVEDEGDYRCPCNIAHFSNIDDLHESVEGNLATISEVYSSKDRESLEKLYIGLPAIFDMKHNDAMDFSVTEEEFNWMKDNLDGKKCEIKGLTFYVEPENYFKSDADDFTNQYWTITFPEVENGVKLKAISGENIILDSINLTLLDDCLQENYGNYTKQEAKAINTNLKKVFNKINCENGHSPLTKGATVHHIDPDKEYNDFTNILIIDTNKEDAETIHRLLHASLRSDSVDTIDRLLYVPIYRMDATGKVIDTLNLTTALLFCNMNN